MIISRRNLLVGSGAAALTLACAPVRTASAGRLDSIGLQLFTLRQIFSQDPVGTLEQAARIGYREVEYGGGGYEAMDHAMLRGSMDRLGLTAPSIHVGYDALLQQFDRSVEMARALGADTIVLPFMGSEHRTEQGWQAALPNFNRFAADLKSAGLGFAYHNHDFEFTLKPGGVSLFERFVTETDPALVMVELDLYWTAIAGESSAALIERLSDRLYAYHVKDMGADRAMAAVGEGTIDFASLFSLRGSAGVRHFYVENDQAPAPYIPDITTSFRTLNAMRF
jgi:sugar phosphate isomerase/epimerase